MEWTYRSENRRGVGSTKLYRNCFLKLRLPCSQPGNDPRSLQQPSLDAPPPHTPAHRRNTPGIASTGPRRAESLQLVLQCCDPRPSNTCEVTCFAITRPSFPQHARRTPADCSHRSPRNEKTLPTFSDLRTAQQSSWPNDSHATTGNRNRWVSRRNPVGPCNVRPQRAVGRWSRVRRFTRGDGIGGQGLFCVYRLDMLCSAACLASLWPQALLIGGGYSPMPRLW